MNKTPSLFLKNQLIKLDFFPKNLREIQTRYSRKIKISNKNQRWFIRHGLRIYKPDVDEPLEKYMLHHTSVIFVYHKNTDCRDMRKFDFRGFRGKRNLVTKMWMIDTHQTIQDFVDGKIKEKLLGHGDYDLMVGDKVLPRYMVFCELVDVISDNVITIVRK